MNTTINQSKAAVSIDGRIKAVYPDTRIVVKGNQQQFWFTNDDGRKLLAVKSAKSGTFKVY